MKEALLYKPLEGDKVLCTACARYCKIGPGQIGLCGIRQNIDGKLHLLVYGKVIAGNIDPIEKKPVTHYMPGSKIFSIATTGCNWLCHPAGTDILLADGAHKPVEEIAPGDVVRSYDLASGTVSSTSVVTHVGARYARVWEVVFDSGPWRTDSLLLTKEHPVFTQSGWIPAAELEPGMRVLKVETSRTQDPVFHAPNERLGPRGKVGSARGGAVTQVLETGVGGRLDRDKVEWVEVCTVRPTDRIERVFSFETVPDHNYVAAGIVVHNCQYCFPGETPITTDRGIVPIEDLWSQGTRPRCNANGEVADVQGVRVRTHRGRLRPVTQVYRHLYSGDLLELRPYYLPPLRCTPDHRVFAKRRGSSRVVKVAARNLAVGDLLAIPKERRRRRANQVIDTLEILRALPSPPYKRNIRLREKDGIVAWGKARGIPRFLPLDSNLARLLGYYAAEGSFSQSPNRPNSCSAWFSFGESERDRQAEVTSLLQKFAGVSPRRTTQNGRTALVIHNTPFALLMKELVGTGAHKKRVPNIILSSSDPGCHRAFLAGYLNGDGYVTDAKIGTILGSGSVSESLTRGVVDLFFRLGTVPRYYVGHNPDTQEIEGRTVSRANDHLIHVLVDSVEMVPDQVEWEACAPRAVETADHYLLPIRRIDSTPFVGPVYNLAVKDDHSYIANFLAVANCQNFDISQRRKVEGIDATPRQVVDMALEHGCQGLAYTYNQPTIFMEYAHDIGVIAREEGLINIFVSNGFDTPDTVAMMDDFLDCITVDFKGSAEPKFTKRYIGVPDPQPIFDTLREIRDKTDVHIEITDLVVPEVGDDLDHARKLSRFVHDELGPDTPIHFLRFHPDYKMRDLPWTPVETLEKHHAVARDVGLRYVYVGNVPGHPLEHTYCPDCGGIAVRRHGFDIREWNLDEENRCRACGYELPLIGGLQESWREFRFRPVMYR